MLNLAKTKENTDDTNQIGRQHPLSQQHGQYGPNETDTSRPSSDQFDQPSASPDRSDAPEADNPVNSAREHQQIDLAMLRLAFRSILVERQEGETENDDPPLRDVSCSELNQLVSAVVRLHSGERELFGITSPDDNSADKHNDDRYQYLSHLTTTQLIELCNQEGIDPPPACEDGTETQDNNRTGPT